MTKVKLSKKRREEIMKQFGGRMPTIEEIFQKIIESQDRMAQALKGAWETRPEDPEITKKLLEVGERSAKLKTKLQRLFGNNNK